MNTTFAVISDPVLIAAIAAVSSAVASILALIKVRATHDLTNSRMTELLSAARSASHADGMKDGQLAGHQQQIQPTAVIVPAIGVALTEDRLIEILNEREKPKP